MAKSHGYSTVFFEGGNIKVDGGEARGIIDPEAKTVYVRTDHPDFTANQIMRHEMGHADIAEGKVSLDKVREDLHERFTDAELDEIAQAYADAYEGANMTVEEAFEEMCCDALGGMNVFAGTGRVDDARYSQALTSTKKSAERQANQGRAPPKDKGVKYSRDSESITETAKYLQSIGRKSINDFTEEEIKNTKPFAEKYWREMGTKSPFFRAWFGDWRANDTSRVQIATRKDSKRGVQRNDDTGWDINVSGKIFNETRAHTANYNREAVSYLPYINDIVKKAVLLDSYSLGTVKSPNSLLMHSMYAVADIGDGPTFLKLYVEEMNDPNKANTAKRAYQLQNIEKYQQPDAKGSGKFPSPVIQTADVSTISDLFKVVKVFDKNFNPKPASKVVNEDGTPMKVYHGTSDVFWEFKNSELSLNEDSFFFAQNRDDAAAYTGNGRIMSAYVNLQNPVDYNDMPSEIYKLRNKKAQVEALKKLGYDGWMADMETGWGEVSAFYPEQIKSATDNIGTFDASNPDIRYSLESKQLTELRRENERKLAEATEADAQNENERGFIKSYKQQYNKVLDIAVQLDTAKQELLKAEADGATNDATKAKNRVTLLNRQYAREHRKLNSYKETKALQNVLSRVNERTPAKDSTHIDNRSFSSVGDRKGGFTLEEKEILNLRADGKSLIEIADRMHCSVETVNRRIRCIKIKIADIVKG